MVPLGILVGGLEHAVEPYTEIFLFHGRQARLFVVGHDRGLELSNRLDN